VRSVHESNTAESVMPGRRVAELRTLNPDTGVRIAPRQPIWEDEQKEEDRIRGVVKATVTSLGKKHTVSAGSLLDDARSSNWPG
jgi:hypothetical protein